MTSYFVTKATDHTKVVSKFARGMNEHARSPKKCQVLMIL